MRRRLNITLPEETVKLMDRVTRRGERSRLIAEAVERYMKELSRVSLKRQLRQGAQRRARRDLELAEEWFALDEETWHRGRK